MKTHRHLVLALSLLCLGIPNVWADILHVPSEYETIQSAIDAAYPGDQVVVAAGTYSENLRIKVGIELAGAGSDSTIIRGPNSEDVITVDSNAFPWSIHDLTIQAEGRAEGIQSSSTPTCSIYDIVVEGGENSVEINHSTDSHINIHDVTVRDCTGVGLYVNGSSHADVHVEIRRATVIGSDMAIRLSYATATLEDSLLRKSGDYGLYVSYATLLMRSSVVVESRGYGIYASHSHVDLGTAEEPGNNEIHRHVSYNCYSTGNSTEAIGNWWGYDPPFVGAFKGTTYEPWLSEPPLVALATIQHITPDVGSSGQQILITGENFSPQVCVAFGGVEATSVEVQSDTSIIAIVPPAGTDGWVDVSVSNPDGHSISTTKGFRYYGNSTSWLSTMTLSQGLNLVSLPLSPAQSLTASSLAESLGSTIVIRAEDGQFEAYVPQGNLGIDFPIAMGKGYIVNLLEAKAFEVTGQPWGVPAAPAQPASEPWAFVVSGRVLGTLPPGASVRVTNQSSGDSLLRPISQDGEFVGAFVDMSQQAVVSPGDSLTFEVVNANGHVLTRLPSRHLTAESVAHAHLHTTFQANPQATRLLPNFPNPFNPETWIPYQLAEPGEVTLRIFDTGGREVRRFELGWKPVGWYDTRVTAAHWDGRNGLREPVGSGSYWVVMESNGSRNVRRIVVTK